MRNYATDTLSFLLGAHYRDLDGTSSVFRANIFNTGSNSLNQNYDRETVYFDEGDNNPQEYESSGYNLKIDWDIGGMTLTSITAYDEGEGNTLGDIDGGNVVFGPGTIVVHSVTADETDNDQFTQEIRLASDYGDNFNWQVGAFYFDSELDVTVYPFFIPGTQGLHENTTWAVFGQGDYTFGDAWTLTAGLRYTDDEKDYAGGGFTESVSDDQVSGDLSLSYAASDNSLIWAKVGTGFRAPSIQGREVPFFGMPSVADSETINSIEFGYKSQFADDRMRLNAAIFYYEVDDMQLTVVGGADNVVQLVNADTGTGMGFEIDLDWLVTDRFELTFGVAYADTEIEDKDLRVNPCGSGLCTVTNPIDDNGLVIVDGNPFPNAPETTFNFTASYSIPLGSDSELFAFTDWSYQGDTNIFLYEAKEFETDGQYEGGFRAGWRRTDYGLEVAVFGRNITDEENVQGAIDFSNLTGFTNEPRIFGVSVSSEF